MIPAYPKINALGHFGLKELFLDPVIVQEKIDGSQFSFAMLEDGLHIRSKGREIFLDAPDNLFRAGVDYVKSVQDLLVKGWVYRAEYLSKPKHNTLAYSRIPKNHIILFDIMVGHQEYAAHSVLEDAAKILDIEAVPQFDAGIMDLSKFQDYMKKESCLGGQTVEGVVVKNYRRFDQATGHILIGKYVSEAFKEVHRKDWKASNPTQGDVLQKLIEEYRTPARWEKAVYRVRDEGKLENSPKDIGLLIREVWPDIVAECEEEIKQTLWNHFSKHLARGVVAGLPEWYKQRLLQSQFGEE